MQIVFMGTPEFAVPSLDVILTSRHTVAAVITQPDRPKGRHLHLQPSPVKVFAAKNSLPVFQPEKLNEESFKKGIYDLNPDAIAVVAYGKIIPKWMLHLPHYGCINVHASLLPRYRGAAPIQRAIMDGLTETGITTILLDEGMDTGDILLQSRIPIEPENTSGDVAKKLSEVGAELLLQTLDGLEKDQIAPKKQEEDKASYAPKIEKEEALLTWSLPALRLANLIRALSPFMGAHTHLRGERLKVWEAKVTEKAGTSAREPGTVVSFDDDGIVVAARNDCLVLTLVQPENKRKMEASEFLKGHKLKIGEKLNRGDGDKPSRVND